MHTCSRKKPNKGLIGSSIFHDLSYVYANGAFSDLSYFRVFSFFVIRHEREAIFSIFICFELHWKTLKSSVFALRLDWEGISAFSDFKGSSKKALKYGLFAKAE